MGPFCVYFSEDFADFLKNIATKMRLCENFDPKLMNCGHQK